MSDTRTAILLCKHGFRFSHIPNDTAGNIDPDWCPGGTRIELTEERQQVGNKPFGRPWERRLVTEWEEET